MTFWLAATLMSLAVGAAMAFALFRRDRSGRADTAEDIDVYRDQLSEIERDVARGVLSAEEAEPVKVEVSRRILAADRKAREGTPAGNEPKPLNLALALILLLGMTAIAIALYSRIGAPGYGDQSLSDRLAGIEAAKSGRANQATAEAAIGEMPASDADPAYLELVERLRQVMQERPDNTEGHRRLAQAEATLGNFRAAHEAQARVVELTGGESPDDVRTYAEYLILAAGGYVSPEAEVALVAALTLAPDDPFTRYYAGLLFDQTGRPDRAFNLWRGLLESSGPDDPWVPPIEAQIEGAAARAGISYRLPAIGSTGEEQSERIRGMVAGLADRLATEGGTPEEWARLVRAYGVLGETENAAAIWVEAQELFQDDPQALALIRVEAEGAGIAE
jgi:cytochrome c-type biogenesis protein CcmH